MGTRRDGDAKEVPNVRISCVHTGVFVVVYVSNVRISCVLTGVFVVVYVQGAFICLYSGRRREGETRVDVVETEFGVEKGALDVFHRDS